MTSNWFCKREGQEFGPFSDAQLQQLAATGQLGRRDQVRKQGMQKWVFAEAVHGLFRADETASETNHESRQESTGTGNGAPPPVPETVMAAAVPEPRSGKQRTVIAMPAGITTARAILFVQGGLSLLVVLGYGVMINFMWPAFNDPRISASTTGPEPSSSSIMAGLLVLLAVLLLLAVLPLYAAYQLKRGNRGEAVLAAVLSLVGVPIGTMLGLVVLFSVYRPESTAWLKEQRERAR